MWLHICANLWVKIPKFGGSKKFDKDFRKRNLWTRSPARRPQGVGPPQKWYHHIAWVPAHLKPPRTLWRPVAPSSRKHRLSEDPCFWPKYSNGPGVAKNWHMSKWTSRGPRRCLKLSWDQIWQRNVNGKCPKLPKRNCQSLRYKVV